MISHAAAELRRDAVPLHHVAQELGQFPGLCCGFGGTFCVKFPDISNKMVEAKLANIAATGAEMVLAADMGCLMNIAGKLKRQGSPVQARHVAEVLAGMTDQPAIGEES